MDCLTAEQAVKAFSSLAPETKLCPSCYCLLIELRDEGNEETEVWFCQNEMCLDGEYYDRYGSILS